jgi:hypothetical protein
MLGANELKDFIRARRIVRTTSAFTGNNQTRCLRSETSLVSSDEEWTDQVDHRIEFRAVGSLAPIYFILPSDRFWTSQVWFITQDPGTPALAGLFTTTVCRLSLREYIFPHSCVLGAEQACCCRGIFRFSHPIR